MNHTIERTAEMLAEMRSQRVPDEPIGMLNLLRYKKEADYGDRRDVTPCSGREAYDRYAKNVVPLIVGVGGVPIWKAEVRFSLIAPPGEQWDDVALVAYPSRRAFLQLVDSAAFDDARRHRIAALEDSRLIEVRLPIMPKRLQKVVGWVVKRQFQ